MPALTLCAPPSMPIGYDPSTIPPPFPFLPPRLPSSAGIVRRTFPLLATYRSVSVCQHPLSSYPTRESYTPRQRSRPAPSNGKDERRGCSFMMIAPNARPANAAKSNTKPSFTARPTFPRSWCLPKTSGRPSPTARKLRTKPLPAYRPELTVSCEALPGSPFLAIYAFFGTRS